MKRLTIVLAVACLGGCAYPSSSVNQGTPEGHLVFRDSRVGESIQVDGRPRGARSGAEALVVDVDPGRHLVEEIDNGTIVFHAEYYVGAGSSIEVRSPK